MLSQDSGQQVEAGVTSDRRRKASFVCCHTQNVYSYFLACQGLFNSHF